MNLRGILYAATGALTLYLAFVAGHATAPESDPLYLPVETRADCLEVRLVPDDLGDGLRVRAYLYDGDGHEVWTRDLDQEEPLAALWDQTREGQDAVDLSHWQAEHDIKH